MSAVDQVSCRGGIHVLGYRCPVCEQVTIPARFWPQKDGLVAVQPDDVKRDYPIAEKGYREWWDFNGAGPYAPYWRAKI